MDLQTISKVIMALATMAVLSMDLGMEYNTLEKQIYTHMAFQLVAVSAVALATTEDMNLAMIAVGSWVALKVIGNK